LPVAYFFVRAAKVPIQNKFMWKQAATSQPHQNDFSSPSSAKGRRHLWTLLFIVFFAIALRLYAIEDSCVWIDEANTYHIAKEPCAGIISKLINDSNPPLYYFLLHGWMKVFGTGEFALRSLSLLFGIALIGAVYLLGTTAFSTQTGLWAAFIIAAAPIQIYYSQAVRMYTLLPLLATLSVFFLFRYINGFRIKYLLGYSAATLLALYTHYFAYYLPVLHIVLILCCSGAVRKMRIWLPVLGIIGLLYLPWLHIFSQQFTADDTYVWFAEIWEKRDLITTLYITLVSFSPGGKHVAYSGLTPMPYFKIPALVVYALLAIFGLISAIKKKRQSAFWIICFLLLPIACAIIVSYSLVPNFVSGRVDQMVFPAYVILVALGIQSIGYRSVRIFLAMIIVVAAVYSTATFYPDYRTRGFDGNDRDLAEMLVEKIKPNDVLLCTSLSRASLAYYFEQHALPSPIISFPRSTASHLGGQDDTRLMQSPERLHLEAREVIDHILSLCTDDSIVYIAFVESGVNDALRETLAADEKIQLLGRLGKFQQCGSPYPITLLAYRFAQQLPSTVGAARDGPYKYFLPCSYK
jgi:mannosyltransferase